MHPVIKLKDVPYDVGFYWKGGRYKQVIRPKRPKGKFMVICRLEKEPCSKWVDMPSGRKVKPIMRAEGL